MKAIGNVIASFKDRGKLSAALRDLQAAHYPIPLYNKELTAQHFRVSSSGPEAHSRETSHLKDAPDEPQMLNLGKWFA